MGYFVRERLRSSFMPLPLIYRLKPSPFVQAAELKDSLHAAPFLSTKLCLKWGMKNTLSDKQNGSHHSLLVAASSDIVSLEIRLEIVS